MPISFLPDYRTQALTDLTVQWLNAQDIRLLMLDFDNTIVPYTTNIPTPEMDAWLKTMLASGITLCVVSNSRKDRVKIFCRKYGLDCITGAGKPGTRGVRQCLERYGIPAGQAALVGDQIYTDTLAGTQLGVRVILVEAIDNHNIWLKLRHIAEKPFIFAAKNRRIAHE